MVKQDGDIFAIDYSGTVTNLALARPLYCVIVKKDDTTYEGWTMPTSAPSPGLQVQPSIEYNPDAWSLFVDSTDIQSVFPSFPPERVDHD